MYFSRTSGIAVFLILHIVGLQDVLGDTISKTIEEHQVGFVSDQRSVDIEMSFLCLQVDQINQISIWIFFALAFKKRSNRNKVKALYLFLIRYLKNIQFGTFLI